MTTEYRRRLQLFSTWYNVVLARNDCGSLIDNGPAAGPLRYDLPPNSFALSPEPGDYFEFYVAAAQAIAVNPGASGTMTFGSTTYPAGQSLRNTGVVGAVARVVCGGLNSWRADFVFGACRDGDY